MPMRMMFTMLRADILWLRIGLFTALRGGFFFCADCVH